MKRPIILCADDYGLSPGVGEAVLSLAAMRRLSAISCLVTGPAWDGNATRLAEVSTGIELGLHISLTEFPPLTDGPMLAPGGKPRGQSGLLFGVLAGQIRREEVRREIELQIECFGDALGRRPDFIDGHHHVHQFPEIASAVVEVIAARRGEWKPWLRVCAESLRSIRRRGHGMRDAASASVLGHRLRRKAHASGIATNEGLSGFYDVRKAAAYSAIFPAFLREMGPRHLVVCHPGHCADEAERARPWMRCREHEYAFLAGPGFAELCAREEVRVATFAEIAGAAR